MKNNKGFSLVELIVVIAIMAILAAVAVIGVSVYIPKAQQASDKQLVSDIEYALILAYHNGDLVEGSAGFILLSPNAEDINIDESAETALVLKQSFGSDWQKAMQLKYDSWGVKNQMLSYANASSVVNSTFYKEYSSSELMEEVQLMTSVANGLVQNEDVSIYDMFNYTDGEGQSQNAITDVIEEYKIPKNWDDMSAEEKSNVLVLATASSISNGSTNTAANIIPQYALAAEDPEFNIAYKAFQETISEISTDDEASKLQEVKAAYSVLKTAAEANDFNSWQNQHGQSNQDAFEAIMTGVGNAMKDNGDAILDDRYQRENRYDYLYNQCT